MCPRWPKFGRGSGPPSDLGPTPRCPGPQAAPRAVRRQWEELPPVGAPGPQRGGAQWDECPRAGVFSAPMLTDEDRLRILREAAHTCTEGWCAANAVAIRRLLFRKNGGWAGRFIAAADPAWRARGEFRGHVGVEHEDRIWNSEGVYTGNDRYRLFAFMGEDAPPAWDPTTGPIAPYDPDIFYPTKQEMQRILNAFADPDPEPMPADWPRGFPAPPSGRKLFLPHHAMRKGSFLAPRKPEDRHAYARAPYVQLGVEASMNIIRDAMLRLGYTPPA